jgi:hypothetical protein
MIPSNMAEPDSAKSEKITPRQRDLINEFSAWARATLGDSVDGILIQNDWTFIITLHAMIETALNAALVKQFDAPELSGVIAKLETSNMATGKIAFAKTLKILDPRSVVFIQKLSELRNFCVHDIRNFKFDLDKHLAALPDDKRNELMKPILRLVKEEERDSVRAKEALFIVALNVLIELYIHDFRCENRALEAKILGIEAERYRKQQESKPTTD